MTRSPRWPSYLLVVLVAVLAVILAAAGLVAWVAYGLSRHSPEPDAGAYSRSAAVRRSDLAAATWSTGQLTQLGGRASWLRPAGQSVHDACAAWAGESGISGPGDWTLTCTRRQTAYFGYASHGGDPAEALEHALSQLGWTGFMVAPGSLVAYYSTGPSPVQKGAIIASWLSPATPAALRQLVARYRAEFGQPGEGVGLVQAIPPDPAQLDRVATGRYDNLLMVTLQGSYATARQ